MHNIFCHGLWSIDFTWFYTMCSLLRNYYTPKHENTHIMFDWYVHTYTILSLFFRIGCKQSAREWKWRQQQIMPTKTDIIWNTRRERHKSPYCWHIQVLTQVAAYAGWNHILVRQNSRKIAFRDPFGNNIRKTSSKYEYYFPPVVG